jgi:mannose-6-phosphate isomerase-like protein (cupin superfamily)
VSDGRPQLHRIDEALAGLTFLADRTPETTDDESAAAFGEVCAYRDGGVFVAHWAGSSEWERHRLADEIVVIVEGETTMTFLVDDVDQSRDLRAGDLVVVPQGTWHRFDSPGGVKLMSVTPQPGDHQAERPT